MSSYCIKHKREKIWKEKTGYGYDIYCPECRKEGTELDKGEIIDETNK